MTGADEGRPAILPVLGLPNTVFFPGMSGTVLLRGARAFGAVHEAMGSEDHRVAVFAARPDAGPDPEPDDLFDVGTIARVVGLRTLGCCHRSVADLEALDRARAVGYLRARPFRIAWIVTHPDGEDSPERADSLAADARLAAFHLHALRPRCRHACRAIARLGEARLPAEVPGALMDLLPDLPVTERQAILELGCLGDRLEAVLGHVQHRLAVVASAPRLVH